MTDTSKTRARRFPAVAIVARGRFAGYVAGSGTDRDPWRVVPELEQARPFASEREAHRVADGLHYPDAQALAVEAVFV